MGRLNSAEFKTVSECSRRQFLGRSAQQAAGVAAGVVGLSTAVVASANPSERVRIGIIGLRNQGKILAETLATFPDVELAALCDVDSRQFSDILKHVEATQSTRPRCESDFRRLLDDPRLDAVIIATPDHWHAWMTVLACRAGKDVYLESPATHAAGESEPMVSAVEQYQRVVQVGLQQRSGLHFQSAIQAVQAGRLGTVKNARAWVIHRRKAIGRQASTASPVHVDYRQWLGPAGERPFHPHRFHFNWRWFWDYGGGELAHWGVHWLDVARWGLGVDVPHRVAAFGTNQTLDDDQETPDTMTVHYDFHGTSLTWEHRLWSGHGLENRSSGVAFYGDRGTLVLDRSGWKIYDSTESLTAESSVLLAPHLRNFIDCVKSRNQPVADIRTGVAASMLCHLGNTSYRLQRELRPNAAVQDQAAQRLLNPTARPGWNLSNFA